MRNLFCLILFALGLACTGPKNAITANQLNGNWIPIAQEMGGNTMPKSFYEKQKLSISDSTYVLAAESVDKGIIKYTDGKMDIYGKEGVNAGKHFTAIYKLENDLLTICYNLSGNGYPEKFETNGKPLNFLSVFKKE